MLENVLNITIIGHAIALAIFALAASISWSKNRQTIFHIALLIICTAAILHQSITIIWRLELLSPKYVFVIENLCYALWIYAVLRLFEFFFEQRISQSFKGTLAVLFILSELVIIISPLDSFNNDFSEGLFSKIFVLQALAAISLVIISEQLYRNSERRTEPHRFYLAGLTLISCLEIYHFGYYYLFDTLDQDFHQYESIAMVLVAISFLIGSSKNTSNAVSLSRQAAFYGTSLAVIGLFFITMAIAGFYVQSNNADWSTALQSIIFAAVMVAIFYMFVSSKARAQLQVFINKNFFQHKYDYRLVWLSLIKNLANISDSDDMYESSLKSIAKTIDATGGTMWIDNDSGYYEIVSYWKQRTPDARQIDADNPFFKLMATNEWIYSPSDATKASNEFHELVPEGLTAIKDIWIIAPLLVGNDIIGFYTLNNHTQPQIIWEDLDVIKSVSRQIASYISQQLYAERLAESKQFDAYNKLTAFVMHDLKNLIAQQALVVENAKVHGDNPEFVQDAMKTINNSVVRMNGLLKRLQRTGGKPVHKPQEISEIILELISRTSDRSPKPVATSKPSGIILADREQLIMTLIHIVRNAQDATSGSAGNISISFSYFNNSISIAIRDNGTGMDEEFMRTRLFKPFESTKSTTGMGIGVYQVRELIHEMGGKLSVESEVDVGTTMTVTLPIHKD